MASDTVTHLTQKLHVFSSYLNFYKSVQIVCFFHYQIRIVRNDVVSLSKTHFYVHPDISSKQYSMVSTYC